MKIKQIVSIATIVLITGTSQAYGDARVNYSTEVQSNAEAQAIYDSKKAAGQLPSQQTSQPVTHYQGQTGGAASLDDIQEVPNDDPDQFARIYMEESNRLLLMDDNHVALPWEQQRTENLKIFFKEFPHVLEGLPQDQQTIIHNMIDEKPATTEQEGYSYTGESNEATVTEESTTDGSTSQSSSQSSEKVATLNETDTKQTETVWDWLLDARTFIGLITGLGLSLISWGVIKIFKK